ncbi:MAG: DUF2330 domain-containing protein [Planctomycetota bacterium]
MRVRHPLIVSTIAAAIALVLLPPTAARPCMHGPADYKGSMVETSQQAIIFFDQKTSREELVIRINYRETTDNTAGPGNFGWVVPVPTVPDSYAVEDTAVFKQIFEFVERTHAQLTSDERGLTFEADSTYELELLSRVSVGEYDIQPIRARGAGAGAGLNKWLTANGYNEVPVANMQWYLDRNWTFLAIRINAVTLDEDSEGSVRPLRISFATPEIIYPLKFSSHQGQFDVTLYVITAEPLPRRELDWPLHHSFDFEFGKSDVPAVLESKRMAKYPALQSLWKHVVADGHITFGTATISQLHAWSVNSDDNAVSQWPEDFHIDLRRKAVECTVPGQWAVVPAVSGMGDPGLVVQDAFDVTDDRKHVQLLGTTPGTLALLPGSRVCLRVTETCTDAQLAGLAALRGFDGFVGLDLSRCERLTAKATLALITSLPHLRSVALQECDWLTGEDLMAMATMKRLRHLDVRSNPQLTIEHMDAFYETAAARPDDDERYPIGLQIDYTQPQDDDDNGDDNQGDDRK